MIQPAGSFAGFSASRLSASASTTAGTPADSADLRPQALRPVAGAEARADGEHVGGAHRLVEARDRRHR